MQPVQGGTEMRTLESIKYRTHRTNRGIGVLVLQASRTQNTNKKYLLHWGAGHTIIQMRYTRSLGQENTYLYCLGKTHHAIHTVKVRATRGQGTESKEPPGLVQTSRRMVCR